MARLVKLLLMLLAAPVVLALALVGGGLVLLAACAMLVGLALLAVLRGRRPPRIQVYAARHAPPRPAATAAPRDADGYVVGEWLEAPGAGARARRVDGGAVVGEADGRAGGGDGAAAGR